MARPMLLIREDILKELWLKHREGVPTAKLLAQYNLNMTRPTLAKLIAYYDASEEAKHDEVGRLIKASLFPKWVEDNEGVAIICNSYTIKQPPDYRYEGKMPLGKWVHNDWTNTK